MFRPALQEELGWLVERFHHVALPDSRFEMNPDRRLFRDALPFDISLDATTSEEWVTLVVGMIDRGR